MTDNQRADLAKRVAFIATLPMIYGDERATLATAAAELTRLGAIEERLVKRIAFLKEIGNATSLYNVETLRLILEGDDDAK